jgi:glycosyltransferase involved in cell wall biosynthesis
VGATVTAVIPCFNSAPYVGAAVESALRQTYADIEVVVVNDGSTDDFEQAIRPFERRIRVIGQANRGLSAARNAAVAATDSEFVAYLDADDLWEPRKIERQVKLLESTGAIGLVHTGVVHVDSDSRPMKDAKIQWSPPDRITLVNLLEHNIITASSVLHRRSAFDGRQLFALELNICSDWDLWLRMLAAGHQIGYVDEVLTRYRIHGTNMSRQTERLLIERAVVMERVLATSSDEEVRSTAERLRLASLCDLAHVAYERQDWRTARTLYFKAGRAAGAIGAARLAKSLWMDLLSGARKTATRSA